MALKKNFGERLGFLPEKALQLFSGSPKIWIHGASLGEIRVAAAIVQPLRQELPECAVMVSTMTAHGRHLASKIIDPKIPVVYAPLDLPGCALKALGSVRPDVMAFLETEIWPAWILTARSLGIRLALLNGRISPRSFRTYSKFRSLFRPLLKNFEAFSMISREDADRIHFMGAPRESIHVNGNAKYDGILRRPNPLTERKMRRLFNLAPEDPVIVAGSTRGGEEEMLLHVYEGVRSKHSDVVLILAPRHIKRAADIRTLIRRRGHPCRLRTEIGRGKGAQTEKIIVIDTFGELFDIYSVATLVFCGASLVPLGGQNPLEPAAWGKPVFYGPHMEDFQDAKKILESAGGSRQVENPEEMVKTFLHLLDHPEALSEMGQNAEKAVRQTRAAAHRHAKVVQMLLKDSRHQRRSA